MFFPFPYILLFSFFFWSLHETLRETCDRPLGWEDPLEKGKATPFSIRPREFCGLCSLWSRKELDTTERLSLHFHATCGIFPDQGSNLCPLNWEHRVLTTGPPRKSTFFFSYCVGRISGTFFNMNDGRGFCLNTDHKQKFSMCLN